MMILLREDFDYTDSFTFSFKPVACAITESEIEKYPVVNPDSPTVDKFVIQEESVTQIREKEDVEGPSSKGSVHQFDDDD